MIQFSRTEIETIAISTTGQRNNPQWRAMRINRLTASSFGKAISLYYNPDPTQIGHFKLSLTNPRDISNIPPIKWGIDHEKDAIAEYQKLTGYTVKETGLWLFPNGYLAASPDGMVYSGTQLIGILEVKCPWTACTRNVKTASELIRNLS